MKDKTVHIRHAGDPPAEPSASDKSEGHCMMGHSPADNKSMNAMKDKTIRVDHSDDSTKTDAAASPK